MIHLFAGGGGHLRILPSLCDEYIGWVDQLFSFEILGLDPSACGLIRFKKGVYLMSTLSGRRWIPHHGQILVTWHGIPHDAQVGGRGRCSHSKDGSLEFSPIDAPCVIQVIYPVLELKADQDGVSRCPIIGTVPTNVCPRRPIFLPRRQIKDPMGREDCKNTFQGFWKRGIVLPLLPWPRIGIGRGYIVICSLDRHRPWLLSWLHICG